MITFKNTIKRKLPGLFSLLSRAKQACLNLFIKAQKKSLASKIEKYYRQDPEVQEVISFLQTYPAEMIPYFYTQEFRKKEIHVMLDAQESLPMVEVNGHNIYFPVEMSKEYIKESVRVALMEQDERSPHKYLPTKSIGLEGDVAVLCGASDGIYALQIVDHFKKIYLFEANTSWLNPIRKTLRNYLHKIEIIPYFVSDTNGPMSVSLDSFFDKKRNEQVNYIQADIEGDELRMLEGAKELVARSSNLKLSLCCYHTAHQQSELTQLLSSCGFTVAPSKGFLLMWMQYPLHPPYLRRGVLYATR